MILYSFSKKDQAAVWHEAWWVWVYCLRMTFFFWLSLAATEPASLASVNLCNWEKAIISVCCGGDFSLKNKIYVQYRGSSWPPKAFGFYPLQSFLCVSKVFFSMVFNRLLLPWLCCCPRMVLMWFHLLLKRLTRYSLSTAADPTDLSKLQETIYVHTSVLLRCWAQNCCCEASKAQALPLHTCPTWQVRRQLRRVLMASSPEGESKFNSMLEPVPPVFRKACLSCSICVSQWVEGQTSPPKPKVYQ